MVWGLPSTEPVCTNPELSAVWWLEEPLSGFPSQELRPASNSSSQGGGGWGDGSEPREGEETSQPLTSPHTLHLLPDIKGKSPAPTLSEPEVPATHARDPCVPLYMGGGGDRDLGLRTCKSRKRNSCTEHPPNLCTLPSSSQGAAGG